MFLSLNVSYSSLLQMMGVFVLSSLLYIVNEWSLTCRYTSTIDDFTVKTVQPSVGGKLRNELTQPTQQVCFIQFSLVYITMTMNLS